MKTEDFKIKFKKRLYDFTLKLIQLIEQLPNDNVSKRLGDQLLRSGTSVIANYVEGQSSASTRELIYFLNVSLKSANESKLWINLLKDSKKIHEEKTTWFSGELEEFSKIIAASIITLKEKLKQSKKSPL